MTKRLRVWHPFGFALWPVLDLWARHAEVNWTEPLPWLAGTVVVAAAFYLAARVVCGERLRAGFAATLLSLVFFAYSGIQETTVATANALGLDLRHRYAALIICVFVGTAIVLIRRIRRDLTTPTRIANMVAGILVAFAIVRGVWNEITPAPSAPVANLEPVDGPRPDIYFLVLDRYPNRDVLENTYGLDNGPFFAHLRAKGFVVREAWCNYAKSLASLSSTLNMEYHGEHATFDRLTRELSTGHRVGTFLKARGYRYYHLGNWYTPTRLCKQADVNLRYPSGYSEFSLALLDLTAAGAFIRTESIEARNHADISLYQFEKLEELVTDPGPKFVFAHILLPHPPFAFDRDGSRVVRDNTKEAFVDQLMFTNTLVKKLLERILTQSKTPPVVLLVSDEGPYLRGDDLQQARARQLKIRTGVLHAQLLPGTDPRAIPPSQTTINTFRVVFNRYFGTQLPTLDDRVYTWDSMMSKYSGRFFDFEDVTDIVLPGRD